MTTAGFAGMLPEPMNAGVSQARPVYQSPQSQEAFSSVAMHVPWPVQPVGYDVSESVDVRPGHAASVAGTASTERLGAVVALESMAMTVCVVAESSEKYTTCALYV